MKNPTTANDVPAGIVTPVAAAAPRTIGYPITFAAEGSAERVRDAFERFSAGLGHDYAEVEGGEVLAGTLNSLNNEILANESMVADNEVLRVNLFIAGPGRTSFGVSRHVVDFPAGKAGVGGKPIASVRDYELLQEAQHAE